MKVIIAGGRKFNNLELMITTMTEILEHEPELEIVHGGARGADTMAYQIAIASGIPEQLFKADWKDMSEPCVIKTNQYGEYNALAGMKRNHQMGDYADMAIVFWDGVSTGSEDMISYMEELNKPVYIIKY